jgi:Methyltransferase domain
MAPILLPNPVSKFLQNRPRLETIISQLDKRRLKLPMLSLERLFPDFSAKPVSFYELPLGAWSTPLVDVAMLVKIALCAGSKSVMELGSYRGYTALALARHLGSEARIVTVDSNPRHGEAYCNGPFVSRIERRVASINSTTFAGDARGSFDLLFLDADHSYAGVRHDTEILLGLLSDRGYFVWHDYVNSGRFSGINGVPEYLHELSLQIPLARIAGTWLAIHSPAWRSGAGADAYRNALVESDDVPYADTWVSELPRG